MKSQPFGLSLALAALATLTLSTPAWAVQPPPAAPAAAGQGRGGPAVPPVVSPEVSADRHITFRIYAPNAQAIRVVGGDIPGTGETRIMTKNADGVWSVTLGPVPSGAYRYNFNVDGVTVIDPRSPAISESNNNVWSLALVSGSDVFDTKNVPHGAVAAVHYYSTALGRHRRMHVYTPPGYEAGTMKYPVFYLLHGAGDSDEAWTSVGRAGIILDNLIAAKQARPMVVVMPAGHTNGPNPGVGAPFAATTPAAGMTDDFTRDFTTDLMPYVQKHYRVLNDRANRAIAGLSMGGSQTLGIAIPHLEQFAYIGVFSSGLLGASGGRGRGRGAAPAAGEPAPPAPPFGEAWEKQHLAKLDNAALKKGLKLLWFSTGTDDGLITTTRATVDLLKKHGFNVQFIESPGGHTWLNWRDYLVQFTPQLFK